MKVTLMHYRMAQNFDGEKVRRILMTGDQLVKNFSTYLPSQCISNGTNRRFIKVALI